MQISGSNKALKLNDYSLEQKNIEKDIIHEDTENNRQKENLSIKNSVVYEEEKVDDKWQTALNEAEEVNRKIKDYQAREVKRVQNRARVLTAQARRRVPLKPQEIDFLRIHSPVGHKLAIDLELERKALLEKEKALVETEENKYE